MDEQKDKGQEEQQRIFALARYENGEAPQNIWSSLGRSKSWFYKWLKRRRSGDARWYAEQSRQPMGCSNRTAREIEEVIKHVRLHLDNAGEFCGAQAILWELEDIGIRPLPSERTVNRGN